MPTVPETKNLTAKTPDVLNAIRNSASEQYRAIIPAATNDPDSIRTIGKIMMDYQPIKNEFLTALVNRIGRVIVTSKMYNNPWAMFKRGFLEYGETIEEIFVNIAKPHEFDQETAEKEVFKREIPDVLAAFHTLNYTKFYKQTVSSDMLRRAFLSYAGVTDLISRIIEGMTTGANYDEFLTMKYMIAYSLINGSIGTSTIPALTSDNMRSIAGVFRGVSNSLEFMSSNYNIAGVPTFTAKDDQFIIINAQFDGLMSAEVMATSFNMSQAEFMGHRVLVDSFGALDVPRLDVLFKDQPGYHHFTEDELQSLDHIPAVMVSRDWFMIFDNLQDMDQLYNPEGKYWNHWLHVWKTFSVSPYGQAVAFTDIASAITAVTVSPATATVSPGQTIQLTASVTGTGFPSRAVSWSVNNPACTINSGGLLTVPASVTSGTTIIVTAKSVSTPAKTATATITVA